MEIISSSIMRLITFTCYEVKVGLYSIIKTYVITSKPNYYSPKLWASIGFTQIAQRTAFTRPAIPL